MSDCETALSQATDSRILCIYTLKSWLKVKKLVAQFVFTLQNLGLKSKNCSGGSEMFIGVFGKIICLSSG